MIHLEWDRFEITPNAVGRTIQQFCMHRLGAANPRYLPVHPSPYTTSRCCHQTVAAQIERNGGNAKSGWLIREQPGMYLTADVYVVWEGADGGIVNVTPNELGESRILFAKDGSCSADELNARPSTHFLRTFRPKTYGDYALESAGLSDTEPGQFLSRDGGQSGVDDWTVHDDQDGPLAIAIDDYVVMSVAQNALLVMTADGLVCKDPAAYDLVSRTRAECRKEMMRLWGHNLVRRADAQFLFGSNGAI
jgi:hypothetical protein